MLGHPSQTALLMLSAQLRFGILWIVLVTYGQIHMGNIWCSTSFLVLRRKQMAIMIRVFALLHFFKRFQHEWEGRNSGCVRAGQRRRPGWRVTRAILLLASTPCLYPPLCPAFKPQSLHFLPASTFSGPFSSQLYCSLAEVKEWLDSPSKCLLISSSSVWRFSISRPRLKSQVPRQSVGGVQEENIGDANKNGSFARLRGRLKVSLC